MLYGNGGIAKFSLYNKIIKPSADDSEEEEEWKKDNKLPVMIYEEGNFTSMEIKTAKIVNLNCLVRGLKHFHC